MKILLGGVPFGRNNVGDEAILECVVRIVREARPDAQITVSTDDGVATAAKLAVRTVPLFGFAPPYSHAEMTEALREHDVFIWAGATGLSDYPEIPCGMFRIAQAAGRKTILWSVGMNDELNPAKYRVLPGRLRTVLTALRAVTLGTFDAIAWEERRRVVRAKACIVQALEGADLAVVRDPESAVQLQACGVRREVLTGADSALLMEPSPLASIHMSADLRTALEGDFPRIGFCVSAQRAIRGEERLIAVFDRLVAERDARIVFIPMNPVTDAALMSGLRLRMKNPDRAFVLEGRYEPAEILAVASRMDVIASSRLHLLFFASILHVPVIGISRGSKVDNFLTPFGLRSVGSVEACDFDALLAEALRLLDNKPAFQERSRAVRHEQLTRLDAARAQLKIALV
jgi:polysaccharide pyruvyl transferase WcaK-like protein